MTSHRGDDRRRPKIAGEFTDRTWFRAMHQGRFGRSREGGPTDNPVGVVGDGNPALRGPRDGAEDLPEIPLPVVARLRVDSQPPRPMVAAGREGIRVAGLGAGGAAGGGGPLAGLGALIGGNGLLAIAVGLIVGVGGSGTLLATGAVHFGGGTTAPATSAAGLQLVACPDVGPVIGTIPRGEKVLVTGRSADGGWLQVFYPGPAFDRAWTKAGPLHLESDANGLPIAACEAPPTPTPRPTPEASAAVAPSPAAAPSAEPSPSAAPSPSPSPNPTPTPKPTPKPTPTPSPTPKPNVAPQVSGPKASTATIYFDQGSYCATARKSVTISVGVTDADGLASVTLLWRAPGATSYSQRLMTLSGSTYTATLDTRTDGITQAGTIRYYVVARDANPNPKSTRSPTSGTQVIAVKVCANTGPTFTRLQSSPTSIIADPLQVGCSGSTLSEFQAQATDVDGVKSIVLYFRKPGDSSYIARDFSQDGETWYSFINTVGSVDDISSGGSISWYAVATDGKGVATTSRLDTIDVTRCDAPASFDFGGVTNPVYNDPACSPSSVTIQVYASDRDNAAAGYRDSSRLRVIVAWQATNLRTGKATGGQVLAVFQKGNYFLASFPVTADWQATLYSLTYSATSTDVYGGTTRSFTGKAQFSVYSACQGPS